jgi:hypothetical protein
MATRQEFKAWLKQHQGRFSEEAYTLEDIQNLAIACGFDRQHVAEWYTSAKVKFGR